MTHRWDGDAVKADAERRRGQLLIAAAVLTQGELKKELNRPYPPASKPGEFPALRTGNLREGVVFEPATAAEAGRGNSVRIGYAARAYYGGILEAAKKRLGLLAVILRLRPRLARLLGWGDGGGVQQT